MFKSLLCSAAILVATGQSAFAYQTSVVGPSTGACCEVEDLPYTPLPVVTLERYGQAAPASYAAAPTVVYGTVPSSATAAPAPVPTVVRPAPTVAPAQVKSHRDRRGWGSKVYVGARGGLSIAGDTDFRVGAARVENDYESAGYSVAGVVGWRNRVSPNFSYRLEAELGYQTAEVDSHTIDGTTIGSGAFGDTNTIFGFANLYLDVPVFAGINGTVGGGLGAGNIEFDGHGVDGIGTVMDDDDTVFGYHLDAGISYQVDERLSLEAMYRYTRFVDVELEAVTGTDSETDVDSHNVLVGARYGF